MNRKFRFLTLATVAGIAIAAPLTAQAQSSGQGIQLQAQPLSQAIAALSGRLGTAITLGEGISGSVRTNGVANATSVDAALDQLLAGTGLSWRRSGGGIEIVGAVASGVEGENVLRAVRVEGTQSAGDGAFADLSGFGAGAGANGSSDVTATENTGSLTGNGARVGSKIAQTLRQTPQTVNVITSEQFKQQNLTDVVGALNSTPGVTVVYGTANTPSFVSRGFVIGSYQVDGGPAQSFPPSGSSLSPPDLSAYDHIEILRGSSALYAGAGDPGGVVNLQRKRPLDHQQIVFDGQAGSYNNFRGQLDVSTPVAFDGHLRARGVAAYQDREFFYDRAHRKQLNLYGVLEGDIDPDTIVRGGYRYGDRNDDSPNENGMPRFRGGGDLRLPRSTNFAPDWAYTDETQREWFGQLDHRFGNDWKLNLAITRTSINSDALRMDFRGPVLPDRTGISVATSLANDSDQRDFTVGGSLTGDFILFGRKQSFAVGGEFKRSNFRQAVGQQINSIDLTRTTIDAFNPNIVPAPVPPVNDFLLINGVDTEQYGVYASFILEPLTGLHVNAGVRLSNYNARSSSSLSLFGESLFADIFTQELNNNITPSIGVTYDLNDAISIYASYADIFRPGEVLLTPEGDVIPPRRGYTYEAGIKATPFDEKLNVSLAYFNTKQKNVPVSLGITTTNCCYSAAGGVLSEGVDFQVSGALTPNLQINGGYSYTRTQYNRAFFDALANAFEFNVSQQPEHQAKIWSSWTLPGALDKFTISGGVRYESSRGTAGFNCLRRNPLTRLCSSRASFSDSQPGYAVGDLRIGYKPDAHWELAASLTNITDTRYYASINGTLANTYYGEPRQFMLSARAQY